jgi:hypothetical protein
VLKGSLLSFHLSVLQLHFPAKTAVVSRIVMAPSLENIYDIDAYIHTLTDEILQLDERRHLIQIEVRDLAYRRNMLTDINCLPAEIITSIFLQYKASGSPFVYGSEPTDMSFKDLNVLTSVCRYWRELSIGYAPLWSTICEGNREIIRTKLQRSGSSLLDVRPAYNTGVDLSKLEMLLSELFRIRSLHGWVSYSRLDRFNQFLREPAPYLETAQISIVGWHSEIDPSAEKPAVAFNAPNLISLDLFNGCLRPRGDIPSGLRELSLTNGSEKQFLTVRDLLEVLSELSQLRELYIHTVAMKMDDPLETFGLPTAILPFLQDVYIHETYRNANILLGHLDMNPSASVTVVVFLEEEQPNNNLLTMARSLTATLSVWFRQYLSREAVSAICLRVDPAIGFHVVFKNGPTSDVGTHYQGIGDCALRIIFENILPPGDVIEDFVNSFEILLSPSTQIQEIRLDDDISSEQQAAGIRALFSMCTQVHILTIGCSDFGSLNLIHALATLELDILAPRLRTIIFDGVYANIASPAVFMDALSKATRLESICFLRMKGSEDACEAFRPLLDVGLNGILVEWDGQYEIVPTDRYEK